MKKDDYSNLSLIRQITQDQWKPELEQASSRFHITIGWVAVILDPVFALTDYFNIPDSWQYILLIRLSVSVITLITLSLRKKLKLPSYVIAVVPFLLISLQNAFVYSVIDVDHVLGQNLNYMALLFGAAMFVLWRWIFSASIIIISAGATAFFLSKNPALSFDQFFINGGLLLTAMGLFTGVLIQTRYNLVIKEIRARLALKASSEAISMQAKEIKRINENLERLVLERTSELETKNKALEDAAFINAHKLRSPLASILGLVNLMKSFPMNEEMKEINLHLQESAEKLDNIVSSITETIERAGNGDKP
jgi:signal transduction histidine kinase